MRPARIYSIIRAFARARAQPFTWRDLCPPLEHNQALRNLGHLHHNGELRRLKKGHAGWQSNPSVYALK